MKPGLLPLKFLGLFLLCLLPPATASAREEPLSVDDMMKVEGLGAAVSDPEGRWFLYERVRPYDEMLDYSFRNYAFAKTGHQLWRYDIINGGEPELLPGIDQKPHSFLQGFSPSGRFLAVMQYRLGDLSLVAYDMKGEKGVKLDRTPAFSRTGEHNPVWVSDDQLVFAALPEGELPVLTSMRVHGGRTLARSWEQAWRGDTVTANEVRTFSEDRSNEMEDGALVRANAKTGKVDVIAEGLFADLRVSPDRRFLAALAVSKPRPLDADKLVAVDEQKYTLTLFELNSGQSRALAPHLEFYPYTIAWAPDGRHIAAFGWEAGQDSGNGRFYVVDVTGQTVTRFDHVGLDLASERERGWRQRPERTTFVGDRLAVFARPIPRDEDQAPRFTVKQPEAQAHSNADWFSLSASGDSSNLTNGLTGVSGVLVHAGLDHFTVTADDGAYRIYSDGRRQRMTPELPGRFRFLPPGTFATAHSVARPEYPEEALFNVQANEKTRAVMLDLREGREGKSAVTEISATDATPLAGALNSGEMLLRVEDGATSRLVIARSDKGHQSQEIASINNHLANVNYGSWQVVTYDVKDPEGLLPNQVIESCVLLPPNYNAASPPPLVVEVYPNIGPGCKNGGPKISYANPGSPYLWAGKGYAYARLTNPRNLINTEEGPIAGIDEVIDAGVDALVKRGFADPNRLILRGFSQGGISALYVAANSRKFKAVIAMNSWADLFSHYFGGAGFYSYGLGKYFGSDAGRYDAIGGSDFGIGRTPFDDPEVYYRNSPVFLARQIDAPVMLIHSDMDSFSLSQFDGMYGALRRAGKNARYVRYWGEGHAPSSPANIRDMWRRTDDFLAEQGLTPDAHP